ncbi:MAG: hypothetical protein U1E62_08480 [Alsobacter sp.]
MPTDARAATALPFPDLFRMTRFPAEPPVLGEQDRFVLDLFRLLRLFRERYDEAWLARAEALAQRRLGPEADDLMGAAVMLDNELRCRGVTAYASGRPGDHRAEGAEVLFLAFLDAAVERADAAAARAASALGVDDSRALAALACRFADLCARGDDGLSPAAIPRITAKAKLPVRNVFE